MKPSQTLLMDQILEKIISKCKGVIYDFENKIEKFT